MIGATPPVFRYAAYGLLAGMLTSMIEIEVPAAENISVTEDTLTVDLIDGRTISVPLA